MAESKRAPPQTLNKRDAAAPATAAGAAKSLRLACVCSRYRTQAVNMSVSYALLLLSLVHKMYKRIDVNKLQVITVMVIRRSPVTSKMPRPQSNLPGPNGTNAKPPSVTAAPTRIFRPRHSCPHAIFPCRWFNYTVKIYKSVPM